MPPDSSETSGEVVPAIVLIGLPGSGKSFLAARAPATVGVVATDTIRADLYGDAAIQGSWLQIWAEVEARWQDVAARIRARQLGALLYDATNTARQKRRTTIAALKAAGFTPINGLFLDMPLALCLERNGRRRRVVPEAVIQRMHRQLQGAPPSCQEGFACLQRADRPERSAIALAKLLENRTSSQASL